MKENFLTQAIDLSSEIANQRGFPVGAILAVDGAIVNRGLSDGKWQHDPRLHAEVYAIRQASAQLKRAILVGLA